jgi:hypothetical protein
METAAAAGMILPEEQEIGEGRSGYVVKRFEVREFAHS